ncbi:hypothetical protein AB0O31_10025 [Kitasatospora cineracea]|uniref:hypothetical protein n=1 Tax=Kitasatospora cineracea TaxID=88074 RepID=UPI00341683B4
MEEQPPRTAAPDPDDLPGRLLHALSTDAAPGVLVALLTHPRMPSDLVDQLLDDPSEEVRRAATRRTRDTAALWRAAEDVPTVRAAAAANPHAPADLLAELAADHDGTVRTAAARTSQH